MSACKEHGWNLPCHTCEQAKRHENDRLIWRTNLGAIGSQPLDRYIAASLSRQHERHGCWCQAGKETECATA